MTAAKDDYIIKEGDKVVLKRSDIIQVVEVQLDRKYRLGKTWFKLNQAIGQPYGSCFEAKGNNITRVVMEEEGDTEIGEEGVKDNRNLFDSNDNQKLSRDDIEQMKQKGVSRKDIVDQLVENSATFKGKTEYAQQKYIKKKKKKYQNKFVVLKPTIRHIVEMYFKKGPTKICCLRADSLSQILTQANVQANGRILLVDGCNGIVQAALMEKMAGFGTIVDFYTQDNLVRPAVDYFNFSEDVRNMVKHYPLSQVAELKCWASKRKSSTKTDSNIDLHNQTGILTDPITEEGHPSDISSEEPAVKKRKIDGEALEENISQEQSDQTQSTSNQNTENKMEESKVLIESCTTPDAQKQTNDDTKSNDEQRSQRREEQENRREKRLIEVKETKKLLDEGNFDGLIVAARHQPAPIVLSLIELLSPSRPVVVFSAQLEPLEECYMRLRDRSGIVGLKVTETWLRNYQILPNRTHPEILMNNCSGYMLTATTTTCDVKTKTS